MLVVGSKDLEKFHRVLKELDGGRALPFAAKESLNDSAFMAKRVWEREGRKTMDVRNTWTFKGQFHRVVKARMRKSINQMESVTGSRHRYMKMQEKGFSKRRARGLQIPTRASRIGGDVKRIVSRSYWRTKIGKNIGPRYDVGHSKFGGNTRRYVKGTVREARARSKRYIYLEFSATNRGIYDIGTKQSSKRLKKVWDMSKRTTSTKPNPMLRRTLKTLQHQFPIIHRASLQKQIIFVLRKRGFRVRGANVLSEVARFRGQ